MPFKFYMKHVFLLFLTLLVLSSCIKGKTLEDDIALINTDIQIERFDTFFGKVTPSTLPDLKTAYPFMFSKKYNDSFWLEKVQDTLQIQLFKEVDKTFSAIADTETEIESLCNHLKYYFPEFNPPRFITTTNDVDYRNRLIVTDTIAVIALDSYLGAEHEFYGNIANFIKANLNKDQIVVDVAHEYAKKYTYHPGRKTLLDEMIYFGKLLYFKDMMLPFKTEAERIGYTEEEFRWAIANESYMWRYFVSRELLFSTDSKLPSRFINPAPFSKFYLQDVDTDSPGRLGQYMGWQIVRAYMDQNDISLKEMLIKSTEEIFNNTKFKPRK